MNREEARNKTESNGLAILFVEKPGWSLRGDPYLWKEMQEVLSKAMVPNSEVEFKKVIRNTFKLLTGIAITTGKHTFIKKYSHGGMSSGYIDPKHWNKSLLPLLTERFISLFLSNKSETNR